MRAGPGGGGGRRGKAGQWLVWSQRWFARDAFRASNRFASAQGPGRLAGDNGDYRDRPGGWLDRCGIRIGSTLRVSGRFTWSVDSAHGDRRYRRTGVSEVRARRPIIDSEPGSWNPRAILQITRTGVQQMAAFGESNKCKKARQSSPSGSLVINRIWRV